MDRKGQLRPWSWHQVRNDHRDSVINLIFFKSVLISMTDNSGMLFFSIGSLAKTTEEPGVQNVTVKSTIFSGTTNGFRIKSWARQSTGFVRAIRFIGATMINVRNPIIIDQNYCPHDLNCPNQVRNRQLNSSFPFIQQWFLD